LVGVAGTVAALLPTHGLFVPKHDRPARISTDAVSQRFLAYRTRSGWTATSARIACVIFSLLSCRVAVGGALGAGRAGPCLPSTLSRQGPQRSPGSRAAAGRRVAIAQQPLTLEGRPRTLRSAHPIATRLGLHTVSAERRHTYASHLLEDGFDHLFVQQQLGHAWGPTTAVYTSVGADYKNRALRRALDRAFGPTP
jgi:hypothetical protein